VVRTGKFIHRFKAYRVNLIVYVCFARYKIMSHPDLTGGRAHKHGIYLRVPVKLLTRATDAIYTRTNEDINELVCSDLEIR
jgi:hypothetical protein